MRKEKNVVIKQGIIPEFISGSSTPVVNKQHQPQQAWKALKRVQGSSYFMAHGFTLIELLVVVLIIGILAAVAVPQYQKAIVKTRFAHLQVYFDELIKAHDLYYLTNGTYTDQLENLDFAPPVKPNIQCFVNEDVDGCVVYNSSTSAKNPLASLQRHRLVNNKKLCLTYAATNWIADHACMQLMGTNQPNNSHYYWEQ